MKNSFVAAFAALLLLFAQGAIAEDRKVDLAATEWPPFYGADIPGNGFMTEIIVEAFSRGGYAAEISFLPWKRAFESTRDGKHDGLFTMWYRAERDEFFLFSDPLPANELVLFVKKGDGTTFDGYASLKGKIIGVVRGYAPPPGFEQAGLRVSEARDDEENLRKLLKGRVDMVLTDRIVAQHILNTTFTEEADSLNWLEPPVHVDIQHLVVSKLADNSDVLMVDFNNSLAEMTADGTLDAILRKFGF